MDRPAKMAAPVHHYVRYSVVWHRKLFKYCRPLFGNMNIYSPKRTMSSTGESPNKESIRPCLFSGIQPTGIPHLGNYLGAISQWVELQRKYDKFLISIVDLHSITTHQNPAILRENIRDMAICLLACGINPDKTVIFQQSKVMEHAMLGWILGCMTTMPRLQHLPQWKEKSADGREVGVGLFTYPVLQSADILLYRATHVPVGDDQVKHIELTRDLAKLFNKKYAKFFPIPKAVVGDFKRLKSLRDPLVKMSKSDPDQKSRIDLTDSPDAIREKIKKAVSDSELGISYNPTLRPGISNLIDIEMALEETIAEEVCEECMFIDTLQYKNRLADIIIENLSPIRTEILRLQKEKAYIDEVLLKGQIQAQNIASENLGQVKQLMGLQ